MALATLTLPYGMRNVFLYAMDSTTEALSTGVDLPAMQTFSFSEAEDFEELRGDDKVIAVRGKGPKVEWTLEAGGISLAAYALLSGGTNTLSGTTPNQKLVHLKKTDQVRPYFRAEGQAISDSGGDFHAKVFKCRATDTLEGSMADGTFWMTSLKGTGIGDGNNNLYEFTANETAVAVPSTPPASP
jgi:hypothetical protein